MSVVRTVVDLDTKRTGTLDLGGPAGNATFTPDGGAVEAVVWSKAEARNGVLRFIGRDGVRSFREVKP